MPDNNKNSVIDEQFTDFAWVEMRKMLDEEMPIEAPRRKKRYLLLLLFFCLSLGGLVSVLAWPFQPRTEEKETSDVPVANFQGTIQNEQEKVFEDENCLESEIKTIAQLNSSFESKKSTLNITQPPTISNLASFKQLAPANLPGNPDLQKEKVLTEAIIPTKMEAINTFSALTSELGIIDYQSSLEEQLKAPEVKAKSSIVQALLPAKLGVEGGLFSNQLTRLDGYHLGLTAKYNLGVKSWAIHTGLGYTIQRQQFDYGRRSSNTSENALAFDQNSNSENVQDTTGTGTAFDPNAVLYNSEFDSLVQYATSSFNTRIHRLEMPVLVSFRADDRLYLDLGIQGSYILAAADSGDEKIIPFSNGLFRSADTFAQTQELSAGNNGFSAKNIHHFDLGLRGGISYYPTKKLGLRLHYQFGLINASKSDRYHSYNRALRLSTIYYFNR